jgi:transcriptional regulator with XRE-family HTH domain
MAKGKQAAQLTIAGTQVQVTHETAPIGSLRLNPDNPRIRFLLKQKGARAGAKDLMELIRDQPGYDGLQKAIRKAGGLHDPIIVGHDGLVVEGNTRAAAVTTLHEGAKSDPRWQNVPITRLPRAVQPKAMAMLMASYHIAGKTVWRPYAQADQLHELNKVHGWTIEQIADETRMSPKEVQQYLDAYSYLVDEVLPQVKNGAGTDILESKFSHALEFIKHKKTAQLRENPTVRRDFAKLLIDDKIKGIEVRELDKVLLTGANPLAGSKTLKQVEALTKALSKMDQEEIGLLRKSAKARKLIKDLRDAVETVAAVVGISKGRKNGKA